MKRQIKFNSATAELRGPIVDWCGGLRYTKICKLELRAIHVHTNSPVLVVDVLLANSSKYRLQRIIEPNSNQPVDTIDSLLPSESGAEIQPCIKISFSKDKRPDLLFILCVCYGIFRRDESSIAPAGCNFFALALVLSAARVCIPRGGVSINSTDSSVERLWNDAFQVMEDYGHAFWTDTAGEYVMHITRELIRKAAQHEISAHLTGHSNESDTSIIMSAMARVEALVESREVSLLSIWDETWDSYYRKLRKQGTWAWAALRLSKRFRKKSPQTPDLSLDTPVTGRQAGRLPSRVQLRSLGLSNTSLAQINTGLIGAQWSRDPFLSDATAGKREETRTNKHHDIGVTGIGFPSQNFDRHPIAANSGTGTQSPQPKLDAPALVLQDVNDRFVWISAVEIAIEKAWDVAWSTGVRTGEIAARKAQGLQSPIHTTGKQPHTQYLGSNNRPKSRTHVSPAVKGVIAYGNLAAQWLAEINSTMSVRYARATSHNQASTLPEPPEKPEVQNNEHVPERKGVKMLQKILTRDPSSASGNAALTHSWIHTTREYEKQYQAEKKAALRRGKEVIERYRSEGLPHGVDLNAFVAQAWGFTPWAQPEGYLSEGLNDQNMKNWKDAWILAWQAVWNQAWYIAAIKGVDFGVEGIYQQNWKGKFGPVYTKLMNTESHEKVRTDIGNQEQPFSTLEQYYFMLKELHHLFESYQSSIHSLHYDHLRIEVLPKEQVSYFASIPRVISEF
ncbi:unnamed protein product [Rhizoctonia solani]|uniref:Uncharacterized protein n=1 Tax=Rhizoctonia solani TaxID=456999 RepID=A0A8H3HJ48_9AGAM|nr:unnamed protein product [Rhizoctonia solani]